MSTTVPGTGLPSGANAPFAASPFVLPARRKRIGAGAEEPPARLLTMLAIAFLLASPVITLLLAVP